MRLSILVTALESRDSFALLSMLHSQAAYYPDDVEILVERDNGSKASGVKRQELINRAVGDYVAFVDDDDMVRYDYVESILSAASHNPDVVTFNLRLEFAGVNRRSEVWRYGLQEDNRRMGLMAANHLCAWKAELARQVGWTPFLGYGDDQLWYKPLMLSKLPKTEVHIYKELYLYQFNPAITCNQSRDRIREARNYAGAGLRVFRTPLGKILVESPGAAADGRFINAVEPDGRVHFHDTLGYSLIGTARIF